MPIVKLGRGKGVRGLLAYLRDGPKGQHLDRVPAWDTNLRGESLSDWTRQFTAQRYLNERVQYPYLHASLSFDPNDELQASLTDAQMLSIGGRYLERMGLEEHQWVMAVHRDTEHPHVHMVVNRIGEDGKPYDLWQSKERFIEGLRDTEQELGLDPPELKIESLRMRGRESINQAIERSDGTWDGFTQELDRRRIQLHVNSNGKGLIFEFPQSAGKSTRIKASSLGKSFTKNALERRLEAQRNEQTHTQELRHGGRFEAHQLRRTQGIERGGNRERVAGDLPEPNFGGGAAALGRDRGPLRETLRADHSEHEGGIRGPDDPSEGARGLPAGTEGTVHGDRYQREHDSERGPAAHRRTDQDIAGRGEPARGDVGKRGAPPGLERFGDGRGQFFDRRRIHPLLREANPPMVTNLREELRWTRFRLNYASAVGLVRDVSDPRARIAAAERHLVNAVYDAILEKHEAPAVRFLQRATHDIHQALTDPELALKQAVHHAIRKGLSRTLDLEPAISTLSAPVKIALFVITALPELLKGAREIHTDLSPHSYERGR
jgi:Relaxase/Mobilisation nuclease domain